MATEKSKNSSSEDVLALAKERWLLAVAAERDVREESLDDLNFRAGKQWDDSIRLDREKARRPCLTSNRLPQFIRQVTNDQRQNRPSIKVSPVDDKADIETAKVYQGMIRHIEYNSNADVAYDTAFEGAVTHGFGYFRVVTDYCDPNSFDQEILIKRIRNPFTVYLDPDYQEPDASDANWGFVFEDKSPDDYKAEYGESDLAKKLSAGFDFQSFGDTPPDWITDKHVRVAEYFYKTFKKVTIAQLSNGETIDKAEFVDGVIGPDGQVITIVKEREVTLPAIKWCKTNGFEILEQTDWLGKWIPIIPVLGDELDIDGKRILEGIVRHSKDPQREYNYYKSAATEMVALAPKAPFIGAAGQFEGFEALWSRANTENIAFLEYNAKSISGTLAPPPQRQAYEPAIQAITQQMMQSAEDMKATTGIYDASLGARSNENSGIAIQRRNVQAQTNNFHYIDNLSRAIRHLGRILVDLIPHVYDTARAVRTLSEDGEQEVVAINQIFAEGDARKSYILGHGKYDVTVSSGPSFQTKRQESAAAMLELAKSTPQLMVVAPDLVMKSLDFPGAEALAERFKKTMDPKLVGDEKGEQPIPPQVQAQMQQMDQMIQMLTEKLNESSEQIKAKTLELESKERIAMAQIERDYNLKLAELDAQDSRLLLQTQAQELQRRQDLLRMNEPIESETENGALAPQDQPLTGELSPGQSMGEMP